MKISCSYFAPDKWYFGQKNIGKISESYKHFMAGTDIKWIKSGKIKKFKKKLVYNLIDSVLH